MSNREKIKYISVFRKIIDLLHQESCPIQDYSSYIFQLLFLKWLSNLKNTKNELINSTSRKNVSILDEIDWLKIKDLDQDIGEYLNYIFSIIEEENTNFKGVLFQPNINPWQRISNNTLKTIIDILNFGENDMSEISLVADIYEELVIDLDLYDKTANTNFFIPRDIAKLIVSFFKLDSPVLVYDPACGSGSILVEAARIFLKNDKSNSKIKFFGLEKDRELRKIASINLCFNGANDFYVSSTGSDEYLKEEIKIRRKFDLIITNPPFGGKNRYKSQYELERHKSKHGIPPGSSADYAFIQHTLNALSNEGKAAIIVPHGVLFRGGVEGEIRENIIKDDLIDAIIGLPQNLFSTTKIPTAIIIFNKQKSKNREKRILFIDASHEYETKRKRNYLTDKVISRIVRIYSDFSEELGYSRVAKIREISAYNYLLSISHYVEPQKEEIKVNFDAEVIKIQELEAQRTAVESQINNCLRTLGIRI